MNNDYAGWKDKKGCDRPEHFIRKIKDNPSLTKAEFKELVDDYLLDSMIAMSTLSWRAQIVRKRKVAVFACVDMKMDCM